MRPTGAFTGYPSAVPTGQQILGEDEFRVTPSHLFCGFVVYPSVFANAADMTLIIYVGTDAAVWLQQGHIVTTRFLRKTQGKNLLFFFREPSLFKYRYSNRRL